MVQGQNIRDQDLGSSHCSSGKSFYD